MHEIDKLLPQTRSIIRDRVFAVLAQFASRGIYGPIPVKRLFLMVADKLVEAGVIHKPQFLVGGQRFGQLRNGRP